MRELSKPFLNGSGLIPNLPLARFLPALPEGMGAAWLKANLAPGSLVLDAFGSTPTLALEAARAGYRVLVVSNNPVLSFMLELLASAPQAEEFQSALAELASARRGEERLELHLQALYQTECPNCGRKIQAQAFLWRKGEAQPYARLLRCPHCSHEGEHALHPADLGRVEPPGSAALHRSRALERVSQAGDAAREGAEEALQVFLPRPLYFLSTLINKLEGPSFSPEKRRLLTALVLSACDEATSLWQYPSGRTRPRQLSLPTQFRENNLWLALEAAIPTWANQPDPVPFTRFNGELPPPGGISLYSGRLRSLSLPPGMHPQAALSVLPRPNQAFWTLSAVWAGWIWGREAAQPLHSALERRRYDWNWHTAALHQTLGALARLSTAGLPVFTLLPELVPGFLCAALVAAQSASLELTSLALQESDSFAQVEWRVTPGLQAPAAPPNWEAAAIGGARRELEKRNEPAPYLPLYAAALAALAEQGALPVGEPPSFIDLLAKLNAVTGRTFSNGMVFKRYETRSQNVESGLFWLQDSPAGLPPPLADRVEMEIVRYLHKNPGHTQVELEDSLASQFPGLLTPSRQLVQICLQSYGDSSSTLPERWQLSPQEDPTARRKDLEIIQRGLETLGARLGMRCQGDNPLTWQETSGPGYIFYLLASGYFSRYLLDPPALPPARCILVLPGGRANLVAFKLHKDPRLAELRSSGWRFLKFRLLRQLLDRPNLTIEQFEQILDADPPRWEQGAAQLNFFEELEPN